MAEQVEVRGGLGVPAAVAWPLLLAGLGVVLWGAFQFGRMQGPGGMTVHGPRIEDVRKLATLAVLRVQVASVIEGHTAGATGAVLVKGDADVAVNLDRIELAERDEERRTATLRLPQPTPERPRVDHERTKVYELRKTGLAAINPFADPRSDLLEDAMRAAQAEVERSVSDPAFIEQARLQAEMLLHSFYAQLGWDVRVVWVGQDAK
jgi:hypothetical protein